jgi:dCTP deaminase
MILSDISLRAELDAGTLVIDPPPADAAIQPASIDLHLGDQICWADGMAVRWGHDFVVSPNRFYLAHTAESVTIPAHLVAQLDGKSSLARLGLSIHQTAGWIDPGFKGQITLEIFNASAQGITLHRGMPIGQLVLMRLTAPAERPYGSAGLGSHYQGQTGATPSAVTR